MNQVRKTPLVIIIAGLRDTGKTTLVSLLIRHFSSRIYGNLNILTMKSIANPETTLEIPRIDTFSHRKAGAVATIGMTHSELTIHIPLQLEGSTNKFDSGLDIENVIQKRLTTREDLSQFIIPFIKEVNNIQTRYLPTPIDLVLCEAHNIEFGDPSYLKKQINPYWIMTVKNKKNFKEIKAFIENNIDNINLLGFYVRDDMENIKKQLPKNEKWLTRQQIIDFIQEKLQLG